MVVIVIDFAISAYSPMLFSTSSLTNFFITPLKSRRNFQAGYNQEVYHSDKREATFKPEIQILVVVVAIISEIFLNFFNSTVAWRRLSFSQTMNRPMKKQNLDMHVVSDSLHFVLGSVIHCYSSSRLPCLRRAPPV